MNRPLYNKGLKSTVQHKQCYNIVIGKKKYIYILQQVHRDYCIKIDYIKHDKLVYNGINVNKGSLPVQIIDAKVILEIDIYCTGIRYMLTSRACGACSSH